MSQQSDTQTIRVNSEEHRQHEVKHSDEKYKNVDYRTYWTRIYEGCCICDAHCEQKSAQNGTIYTVVIMDLRPPQLPPYEGEAEQYRD